MAINEVRLEGTIHTSPKLLGANGGIVEFILCHPEAAQGGTARFFPIEMDETLAEIFHARKDSTVLVIGKLAEKQWLDPTTGEVRSAPRLHAFELRELKVQRRLFEESDGPPF